MKTSILFVITVLYTLSQPLLAQEKFDNQNLFIKLKDQRNLPKNKLISKSKHLFGNIYLLKSQNNIELEKSLKNHPDIVYTQRDFIHKHSLPQKHEAIESLGPVYKIDQRLSFQNIFNDPMVSNLWAFKESKNHGMSVLKAYENIRTQNLEEIIVAVVDTGVDYHHEDLSDAMWTNTLEIPGNGIDDDQNGYIDDVYGIDTLKRDANGDATTDPMASHWHGTHVSGTIAATQNNGIGIAGVASNAKIMALRTVPDNADERDSDIVEAFLYAAKHGARIINCSFGKSLNEGGMVVNEAIDEIGKKYNVLVVAAAGNETSDIDKKLKYPASFPSKYLMVVASTTQASVWSQSLLSSFSNWGLKNVDLAAPGSSIYSTMKNNKYGNASGTSMAAPNAAGVAAVILGHKPDLSALELKNLLMSSVVKIDEFSSKMVTGGRIDLDQALLSLKKKY